MELPRERTEAGFGGHELVLLTRDDHEVKSRLWFESRGPILSEGCNELAAYRHIPQLPLPESHPGCLAQTCAGCAEKDHLIRAISQPGVIDQCTLYDESSHAVSHHRKRSVSSERIDACLSLQKGRENGKVRISGPYSHNVGAKGARIAQRIDIPICNNGAKQAW